jgi:glycosyltransferase involved in cell wall biosynthesis
MLKVILFANTDWFLYNFRLQTAKGLRDAGYDVLLVSPDGEYVARLKAAGFAWREFPISRRGMNPLVELWTIVRLFLLLRQEEPDFLNNYTIKCVIYGSFAAQWANISHVVNTITGLGFVFSNPTKGGFLRWLVKQLYRLALKRTNTIFINQDDKALFLRNKMVPQDHCVIIESCGVDIVKFSPAKESSGIPMVLFAGRLLIDKGIQEFIEAARIINEKELAARFVLVGQLDRGNPASISEEQLVEWQQQGLVEYWGWQDDMVKIYHQAHIVCLPAYREGVPKSLLEAAACEKPLVATDVPGCRAVVNDGENGFLVPSHDSEKLADALTRLIEDKELRENMGKEGRIIVSQRFSDEQVVEQTLAFYQSLMS